MDSRQYPEKLLKKDLIYKLKAAETFLRKQHIHKITVESKQLIEIILNIPWSSVCNEKDLFLVKAIQTSPNVESESKIH